MVRGVDHNEEWYNKISKELKDNNKVEVNLMLDKQEYITKISKYDVVFDVIVIDGAYRFECAQEALKKLRSGGLIILDNSEWWTKTSKYLREKNLIQVDMSGFGPINGFTTTTSFFFHRDFNFKPIGVQPVIPFGGINYNEEDK
jgi:hypothetical protein